MTMLDKKCFKKLMIGLIVTKWWPLPEWLDLKKIKINKSHGIFKNLCSSLKHQIPCQLALFDLN